MQHALLDHYDFKKKNNFLYYNGDLNFRYSFLFGRNFLPSNFRTCGFNGNDWKVFDLPDSIHGTRSITIDDEGNKWISTGFCGYGCEGRGLIKLAEDDTSWTVYNTANSGLTSNVVLNVSIDKFGNKWMATVPEEVYVDEDERQYVGGGLVKFDGSDWIVYDTSNSELPNGCGKVLIDSKNNKWLLSYPFHN